MKSFKEFIIEKQQSGGKETYQKFFDGVLKKFNVKSPSELDDKKKKEFFDYVDTNWKADKESDKDIVEESKKNTSKKEYTDKEKAEMKKLGMSSTEYEQMKAFESLKESKEKEYDEKSLKELIKSMEKTFGKATKTTKPHIDTKTNKTVVAVYFKDKPVNNKFDFLDGVKGENGSGFLIPVSNKSSIKESTLAESYAMLLSEDYKSDTLKFISDIKPKIVGDNADEIKKMLSGFEDQVKKTGGLSPKQQEALTKIGENLRPGK